MITLKEISHLLSRCSYKPGSEFKCEPVISGLGSLGDIDLYTDVPVMVHISLKVVDVRTGTDTFVRGSFKLERGELEVMDQYTFLERLRSEILRSEEHEANEWFLVDGNCYQEPHPELRRKLAWHQKEPNTDQSQRIPPRDPRSKMRWPDLEPVSAKGQDMISPEDVVFPMLSEEQKTAYQKMALDSMVTAMKSGRMKGIPTPEKMMKELITLDEMGLLKEEAPLPGAPNGKRTMPMPTPKPPKKIKMNVTSAMGIKLKQPTKPSQLRSSQRNK